MQPSVKKGENLHFFNFSEVGINGGKHRLNQCRNWGYYDGGLNANFGIRAYSSYIVDGTATAGNSILNHRPCPKCGEPEPLKKLGDSLASGCLAIFGIFALMFVPLIMSGVFGAGMGTLSFFAVAVALFLIYKKMLKTK